MVEVSAGPAPWMAGSRSRSPNRSTLPQDPRRRRGAAESHGLRADGAAGIGEAGRVFAAVAGEIDANLVVVGHRPDGPLARWWFGSVGTYLVKNLRCSVLVAQTEIGDEEFAKLLTGSAVEA